jgi:hypothetical protein
MKPEIEDMIQALQGEKVSFYQAKVVIDSIEELSADEKREALRRFIPADKVPPPAPTNNISPPAPAVSIPPSAPATKKLVDRAKDLPASEPVKITAARIYQEAAAFLAKYKLVAWCIFWGLVIYFSFFALWAIARYLERLIMRI